MLPGVLGLEARRLFTLIPTSTALTASATTAVSGQRLTFTAKVTTDPPGVAFPGGTVTFKDGGTTLGSAALSGGTAAIEASLSAVAVHTITAIYSGDAYFAASGTGDIGTIAGTGTAAYTGDNGTASSSTLNFPHGVSLDAAGNLYIADTNNQVIREVVKATSQIVTVAGNGMQGDSGDGGPATDAELDGPYGVVTDSAGNLYISDAINNRIREVVKSTGDIITIAGNGSAGFGGDGGPADDPSVELNNPRGIALDSAGNLYIADLGNNRIREIVKASGQIITLAGDGTAAYNGDGLPATRAELNGPRDVAVDSAGDVFIADTDNNRIREVIHSDGNLITVAGTGVAGYTGDGGPATSATLISSLGVALDDRGDIFIADNSNQVIREVVRATGDILTVAGDGTQGAGGDGGPATSAQLDNPRGMAIDPAGYLDIADASNSEIRRVALPARVVVKAAPTTTVLGASSPTPVVGQAFTLTAAVTVDGPGLGVPSGNVTFLDGSTPIGTGTLGPLATASISVSGLPAGTHTIKAIYSGDLRFAGSSFSTIGTVAGTGTQGDSGDNGPATAALLNKPHGIAIDSEGNLFIADTNNQVIREVVKATGVIITVAGDGTAGFGGDGGPATDAELSQPAAVAVDPDGNLFIADSGNNRVREVVKASGEIVTVVGVGGAVNSSISLLDPRGLALDTQGNLFIANLGNQGIAELVKATGALVGVAGNGTAGYTGDGGPATAAELNGPRDVAVDPAGNLYIADTSNNVIREVVAATGEIITVAGTGVAGYSGDGGLATDARLSSSLGIAVDPLGNLFITDNDNELIREVVKATGQILTVAGDGTEGYRGDGGPAISSALSNPRGLALDAAGNLYITDASNNAIREVKANVASLSIEVQAPATIPTPTPTPIPTPTPTPTTITLSSSTPSPAYGQLVVYTASVQPTGSSGVAPTGTVVFSDGSTVLGSASLVGGQATLSSPIYGAGLTHSIVASYRGDGAFSGGSSAGIGETVVKADVEVILAATAVVHGKHPVRGYTLKVTLANHDGGLDPSDGTVTYYVGGHAFIKQQISGDTTGLVVSSRLVQGHNISVRYGGDANFNGGMSQSFKITRKGIQPTARPAVSHARHAFHLRRAGR